MEEIQVKNVPQQAGGDEGSHNKENTLPSPEQNGQREAGLSSDPNRSLYQKNDDSADEFFSETDSDEELMAPRQHGSDNSDEDSDYDNRRSGDESDRSDHLRSERDSRHHDDADARYGDDDGYRNGYHSGDDGRSRRHSGDDGRSHSRGRNEIGDEHKRRTRDRSPDSRHGSGSDGDQSPRSDGEKEEQQRRKEDPAYVPREGAFYDHDDRSGPVPSKTRKPPKQLWDQERDESPWQHDMFEKMLLDPEAEVEVDKSKRPDQPHYTGRAWRRKGRRNGPMTREAQERVNMSYQKKMRRRQRQKRDFPAQPSEAKERRRQSKQRPEGSERKSPQQRPRHSEPRGPPTDKPQDTSHTGSQTQGQGQSQANGSRHKVRRFRKPRRRLEYRPKAQQKEGVNGQSQMNPNAKEFTYSQTSQAPSQQQGYFVQQPQQQPQQQQPPAANGVQGNYEVPVPLRVTPVPLQAVPVPLRAVPVPLQVAPVVMTPVFQPMIDPTPIPIPPNPAAPSATNVNGTVVFSQPVAPPVQIHEEGGTMYFSQNAVPFAGTTTSVE